MALYQHSAFRRYMRNRRGVLLHDYQQRRLAERQRGGAWMDFRSARYLCFLEAGECNLRFLYLRSAPGTEILRTEEYVCNPDRILRRAAVPDYGSCPCHLFHEEE